MGIRWTEEDVKRYEQRSVRNIVLSIEHKPLPILIHAKSHATPNKAETEYGMRLQAEFGIEPQYEALTFKMRNGHKYTPDWIVIKGNEILCVEVKVRGKDGFRHHSYQRARLAFDQATIEWPMISFRWAERSKGQWNDNGV